MVDLVIIIKTLNINNWSSYLRGQPENSNVWKYYRRSEYLKIM